MWRLVVCLSLVASAASATPPDSPAPELAPSGQRALRATPTPRAVEAPTVTARSSPQVRGRVDNHAAAPATQPPTRTIDLIVIVLSVLAGLFAASARRVHATKRYTTSIPAELDRAAAMSFLVRRRSMLAGGVVGCGASIALALWSTGFTHVVLLPFVVPLSIAIVVMASAARRAHVATRHIRFAELATSTDGGRYVYFSHDGDPLNFIGFGRDTLRALASSIPAARVQRA